MIKHLSQKHEVTVASLVRSQAEARSGRGLGDYCAKYYMGHINKPKLAVRLFMRLLSQSPLSMGYFYSKELYQRIQKEIEQTMFDLIIVHCSSVAQYVENVGGVPKILDFGDMDSQKWLLYSKKKTFPLNIVYHIEGHRLQKAEFELAKKFDCCTCTTIKELNTLKAYNAETNSNWFPNGVDSEYFKSSDQPYQPDSICFIGRMDYYPNQECIFDFCNNTLPLIKAKRPNVKLTIIGADPPYSVRKLENIPGVTVTGSVADVRPYANRSAVNIAPLNIARGTQNKVLESLSMGVPVVASAEAAQGVDCVPGKHFLTASSNQEFANAVIHLLSDGKERNRFSKAGRARILSHHSWDKSMQKLDKIIADCLAHYKN